MARILTALFVFLVASSGISAGQNTSRVEIFGGYQYLRANSGLDISGLDDYKKERRRHR